MKIYHQLGHNYKWNLDLFTRDSIGDGVIFSPVNMKYDKLASLPVSLRKSGFLDPQYYMPKEEKGSLSTYSYFPSVMVDNFQTSDFKSISKESASRCVQLQIDFDFQKIIIPTRFFKEPPSDFFQKAEESIVIPYLSAISQQNNTSPVLLSAIVTTGQLIDEEKFDEYLSWITALEIDGVYLIFYHERSRKQIQREDFLFKCLQFIHYLKDNDLWVVVGYCNTEGLLYSAAMPDAITMGSYENLRFFREGRFVVDDGVKRGPKARFFSSKLLQWIDSDYIGSFSNLMPDWENLFLDQTPHKDEIFDPEFNWHFTKPGIYKHFFHSFYSRVLDLPEEQPDRIHHVDILFREAINCFQSIESSGIFLDNDSDGGHLPHWLNVISMFKKFIRGH